MSALATDSEARYEYLLDAGVFVEEADGSVAVTESFDAARGVYQDSYADASDERFHETLAELFDLSVDEAEAQAAELGVTRDELVAYLSLRSYLDEPPEPTALVQLAAMVSDVAPASPVPDSLPELTDDDYETFLDDHPDAVVFVWKLHCAPCDEMKADLGAIRAAAPEGVAFAGVDGESVAAFRREFDVDAAPATLTFADGSFVEAIEGRRSPSQFADMFANAFGDSGTTD
jgi:thiol-disulfide isomerase/thioredoxin